MEGIFIVDWKDSIHLIDEVSFYNLTSQTSFGYLNFHAKNLYWNSKVKRKEDVILNASNWEETNFLHRSKK